MSSCIHIETVSFVIHFFEMMPFLYAFSLNIIFHYAIYYIFSSWIFLETISFLYAFLWNYVFLYAFSLKLYVFFMYSTWNNIFSSCIILETIYFFCIMYFPWNYISIILSICLDTISLHNAFSLKLYLGATRTRLPYRASMDSHYLISLLE